MYFPKCFFQSVFLQSLRIFVLFTIKVGGEGMSVVMLSSESMDPGRDVREEKRSKARQCQEDRGRIVSRESQQTISAS